jgi:hypothetical protein
MKSITIRTGAVAQTSSLPYRRFAIGRASDRPRASHPHSASGLETRATADWKSALRLPRRAAPGPIFGARTQSCCHRIVSYVTRNSCPFVGIPDPMIECFWLAKTSFGQSEHLFGTRGRELLPALHDVSQKEIRHWPKQNMDMVWHDNPFPQNVTLLVEEPKCADCQFSYFRSPQIARARSSIQIALNLSNEFAVDHLLGRRLSLICSLGVMKRSQVFRSLSFVAQQYLFRERVCQSKCDEVFCTLSLNMWKVASGVNAASVRIGSRLLHRGRSQLILDPLQSGVVTLRVAHRRILRKGTAFHNKLNFHQAVVQGRLRCWPPQIATMSERGTRRGVLSACGLEIRETADWKSALPGTAGPAVPQVFNLLSRRFAIGRAFGQPTLLGISSTRGLDIRHTADWNSALLRLETQLL